VGPRPLFVQVQSGTSNLAATFPHPSLRAALPTRGRERKLLHGLLIPIEEEDELKRTSFMPL